MKIAIAGAGTTGAYCYRLLKKEGFDVHLFDRKKKTACGINPCAWGISRGFMNLASLAGLSPEKYILERFQSVLMDEVPVEVEIMTFDKPAFIQDLLGNSEIREGFVPTDRYDRIIDATGVSVFLSLSSSIQAWRRAENAVADIRRALAYRRRDSGA